jgi:heme-degrading monooxygenase HmoA
MILRRWTARATNHGAREYETHFRESVLPALAALAGHRGAYLLRRVDGDSADVELTVMTLWNSMEDVQAFAGDNPQHAVVEPHARQALTTFDELVSHHELIVNTTG